MSGYKKSCPECSGTGLAGTVMADECSKCRGTGQVWVEYERDRGELPDNHYGGLVNRLEECNWLSSWEEKFTKSIRDQVIETGTLSIDQVCKADEILTQRES